MQIDDPTITITTTAESAITGAITIGANIAATEPAISAATESTIDGAVILECSACGAPALAACKCRAPYLPKADRAAAAIAAHPEKSDRTLAGEIGVSRATIQRARDAQVAHDEPPGKRVGRDGKHYPAKPVAEGPRLNCLGKPTTYDPKYKLRHKAASTSYGPSSAYSHGAYVDALKAKYADDPSIAEAILERLHRPSAAAKANKPATDSGDSSVQVIGKPPATGGGAAISGIDDDMDGEEIGSDLSSPEFQSRRFLNNASASYHDATYEQARLNDLGDVPAEALQRMIEAARQAGNAWLKIVAELESKAAQERAA
jgi:hypothetical protein